TRHSDEKKLINVVEEMSIASGIPAPQLYVLDKEEAINAFVAGFRPSETVLVVTHGTLKKLDRDELQGVIAHEFSHIFNADMRLNLRLIAVLAGILALGKIGEFMLRGSSRRSSSNRKGR
ncbi:MAG TPA: protease, partial [Alcanivorax sp.]|nr:protease [Alcanivorax sp.]